MKGSCNYCVGLAWTDASSRNRYQTSSWSHIAQSVTQGYMVTLTGYRVLETFGGY